MHSLIGKTLKNRYQITKLLGHGGMAEVYLAADKLLESEVAVKIIQTENILPKVLQRGLKRFQIEAKKMAALNHPNIVPVFDYGEHEGQPFMVMRYLVGGTLKKKLGSPMPYQETITLLLPVADALAYAHSKGLVHRDVKPSNILLTEGGQPMLSDFGVAKVLEGEETLDLTVTGMGVGTPEYMAPEQIEGKAIDARADIYALGVVLYELLTGRKPFEADTPMAVLIKHARDPLPNPGQYVKNLPNEVEQVLYKALAKQPGERHQSMADMMAAMQGALKPKHEAAEAQPAHRIELQTEKQRKPAAARDEPKVETRSTLIGQQSPEGQQVRAINTKICDKDGMVMVYVPAGEFIMGSDEGDQDEQPAHKVYLDAFWIDQTPVTNAMFAQFLNEMEKNDKFEKEWIDYQSHSFHIRQVNGIWEAQEAYQLHPVVTVSWYGAQAYSQWAGRRLPTEAEWEKAARGTDGRIFPWGNEQPNKELLNFKNNIGGTTEVGSYPQGTSPYGALDMAGNVWEWVSDWYEEIYYGHVQERNPIGPSSGDYRVLRGGSWYDSGRGVRAAYRIRDIPDDWIINFGFRCACGTSP